MTEQIELHFFRPGEREYVRLAEVIYKTKSSMIIIATDQPRVEVIIKTSDPNAYLDDPDVPPKVFIYEDGKFTGSGYFRRLGNVIDIVLLFEGGR